MANEISVASINNIESVDKQRSIPFVLIWIFALAFGLLIGYLAAIYKSNPVNNIPIQSAPGFTLAQLPNGEEFSLADFKGKGVVVNFWASWCHPCKTEMPALEEAWKKYQSQSVVFIGVNVWDENPEAIQFLEEFNVTYLNGVDLSDQIDVDYNLQGIPTTWFISPDGNVVKKVMGPLALETLDEAIALILPEK